MEEKVQKGKVPFKGEKRGENQYLFKTRKRGNVEEKTWKGKIPIKMRKKRRNSRKE